MRKKLIACSIGMIVLAGNVWAYNEDYFNRLADAIYHAEGIHSTKPYGILKPFCNRNNASQCRKACLQTIRKRFLLWQETLSSQSTSLPFIPYLALSYAPLNAKNDHTGSNKNWIKNVSHFMEKAEL